MIIRKETKLEVEPSTLQIHCKVCDNFTASLVDKDGNEIHNQEDGYVPGFIDIDLKTGRVVNWREPRPDELEEWVNDAA